ncbi:hypothetical protein SSS_05280 [Sarcoptes scabiei]|uniref:PHD and RING finger domain-containing protein 1 n=1 Tax=Sarcoptes scabiei TaxID=52283 RepID=A0A834R901_SARSC|nr:hypothetical protein SSS_05280 [Sarcoptes scabiei]
MQSFLTEKISSSDENFISNDHDVDNDEKKSMNDDKGINDCEDDDEEDEEDDETEIEDDSDVEKEILALKSPCSPNGQPTCYICLNNFEGQDIGSPDSCETMHHFCLECIEIWSKQINTCPVDRKSFSFIVVRRTIDGEIVMKVPIKKRSVLEIVTLEDDLTYCEICGRCDREDRLLLCDGCDFGYHCECLEPPLETIPVEEWFCPECFQRLFGESVGSESIQTTRSQRAIARTGAFERVRNRILALRTFSNVTNQTPRSGVKKQRKRRKRKAKSVKRTKSRKTRRKTRKRTKKSKLSTRRLPAADPRSRLASRLGLVCKPISPYGLPIIKPSSVSNRSLADERFSSGIGNLSMFGYELDASDIRSYGDEYQVEGSVGVLAQSRYQFDSPIAMKNSMIESSSNVFSINSVDILSEILNSQEILHAPSSDLSIARDGRIYRNPGSKTKQCTNPSSNSSSSSSKHRGDTPSNSNKTSTSKSDSKSSEIAYCSSETYSSNNNSKNFEQEISLMKPSPVVSLLDERNEIETYSDIESTVSDNCKENEDNETAKKSPGTKKDDKKDDGSMQKSDVENSQKQSADEKLNEVPALERQTLKRRPSIKELFGGDSDEDDDGDEIKQLVAQQGTINVHFPIKMPIVLKTNFLASKKKEESDDVPISKKWIPIYPEMDKSKKAGPKWKAIGVIEQQKQNQNDEIKQKEGSDVKEDESKKIRDQSNDKSTSNEKIDKAKKIDKNIFESDKTSADRQTIVDEKSIKTTKHVRICKHGRPINKNKELSLATSITSTSSSNSNSSISKNIENYPGNLESIKPKIEYRKSDKTDCGDKSNWKKKLLIKAKNSAADDSLERKNDKHGNNHSYERINALKNSNVSEKQNIEPKKSSTREKSTSPEKKIDLVKGSTDDRKISDAEPKSSILSSKDNQKSNSAPINESQSIEHSNINSNLSVETNNSKHRHHHHHRRHHHHKHHHSHHRKDNTEDSFSSSQQPKRGINERKDSSTGVESKNKTKRLSRRTENTFTEVHCFDSKKIFAKGDKIMINVNFKKEENIDRNKKSDKTNKDCKKSLTSCSRKPETIKKERSHSPINHPSDKSDVKSIQSPSELEDVIPAKKSLKIDDLDLQGEFKFLPRLAPPTIEKKLKDIARTESSDDEDNFFIGSSNSFMPTPTQDESQSPILSNSNLKPVLNKSNSPTIVRDKIPLPATLSCEDNDEDEFYDPELPLLSPDRESPLSLGAQSDFKSEIEPYRSRISKVFYPKESIEKDLDSPSPLNEMASNVNTASTIDNSINSIDFSQIYKLAQSFNKNNNKVHHRKFDNEKADGHQFNLSLQNQASKNPQYHHHHHHHRQKQQLQDSDFGDVIDCVDMDVDTSPNISPSKAESSFNSSFNDNSFASNSSLANVKQIWDKILDTVSNKTDEIKKSKFDYKGEPTSAMEMDLKEKFIKKLNRQERVVEEVKLALKPHYQKKKITKDEYKDILRKAVPKICHSRSGEINPSKITKLVEAYIKHLRHKRKKKL